MRSEAGIGIIGCEGTSGKQGILVAPYDIELFGHWWFEGVLWLERVLEKTAACGAIETIIPSEYLDRVPPEEIIAIPESSWGLGGRHYIWQNPDTEWMWTHIHRAEQKMRELLNEFHSPTTFEKRVLNQAARELLLLQSSDWPFLVTTEQAKEYASKRFLEHLTRFDMLADALEKSDFGESFEKFLFDVEDKDNVFDNIDYRDFDRALQV